MGRVLAVLLAWCAMLACDSGPPSEGLRERLEREKREEMEAEVEKRVEIERQKMQQEVEVHRKSGLKVDLPSGAAMDIDPSKVSLVIDVPVSGDVFVAGRAMSYDDLDKLFQTAFAKAKDTQVVIRADKGVPHGRVVTIMEKAKAAGLTRLAIGTAP